MSDAERKAVPFQASGWMMNLDGEVVYATWEVPNTVDVTELGITDVDPQSVAATGIAVVRDGAIKGVELVVH